MRFNFSVFNKKLVQPYLNFLSRSEADEGNGGGSEQTIHVNYRSFFSKINYLFSFFPFQFLLKTQLLYICGLGLVSSKKFCFLTVLISLNWQTTVV